MNKSEWLKLIESEADNLKYSVVEEGQDEMIDFFVDQETQRMDCFNELEDVGHKGELSEIFDGYQGTYKYENNAHFTSMSLCSTNTMTDKDLHAPGAKDDGEKLLAQVVLGGFAKSLTGISEVGTFGARKYSHDGWKKVPDAFNRYQDAYMRHWLKYNSGELIDPESGFSHLKHMAWNALAMLEFEPEQATQAQVEVHAVGDYKKEDTERQIRRQYAENDAKVFNKFVDTMSKESPLKDYQIDAMEAYRKQWLDGIPTPLNVNEYYGKMGSITSTPEFEGFRVGDSVIIRNEDRNKLWGIEHIFDSIVRLRRNEHEIHDEWVSNLIVVGRKAPKVKSSQLRDYQIDIIEQMKKANDDLDRIKKGDKVVYKSFSQGEPWEVLDVSGWPDIKIKPMPDTAKKLRCDTRTVHALMLRVIL